MIPTDRFELIVKGLLERTRAGSLGWGRDDDNTFSLMLSQSRIRLTFRSPSTAPDAIRIEITDRSGEKTFGRWTVSEGEPGWPLLANLLFEVQRRCTGLGAVMAEIEHSILGEKTSLVP